MKQSYNTFVAQKAISFVFFPSVTLEINKTAYIIKLYRVR